jgi:hypothetical protein
MSQWIPINQCPSCLSHNVTGESVPDTNHWLRYIQCEDCGKLHLHNEGDKMGGGFDQITEIITKNMENNKMHVEFFANALALQAAEGSDELTQTLKGNIFQLASVQITEQMYPHLKEKWMGDDKNFTLDWYSYPIPDLIALLEDFEQYPNKIADFKRMLIKMKDDTGK